MTDNHSSASHPENPRIPSSFAEQTSRKPDRQGGGFFRQAIRNLPAIVVLGSLGLLAIWGHETGWSMPKLSSLLGQDQKEKDDWCDEHSVPESICVECNPKLMPRIESTWCAIHGVHNCPLDRPEIAQLKVIPKIGTDDFERAKNALDLKDRPENDPKSTLQNRRIQFASQEAMEKLAIDISVAREVPVIETIVASGEITPAQPLVAPVSAPVSGRTWHLTTKGQLGAKVQRGDLLALVDSGEVGKAKAEFLQAFAQNDLKNKTLENIKPAVNQGAIPLSRLTELETEQREAQIRLMGAQQALMNLGLPLQLEALKGMSAEELSKTMQFFGIPSTIAKQLDPKTTSANLYPVLAPRDGTVTAVKVTSGEMVDPSKTLFVVSDTSQMWLVLNVRGEDVKYLRVRDTETGAPGQPVRFRPDGGADEVKGELVWKSTNVDEKSRTVQVRAEVPNKDGALLGNTFGIGQIAIREEKKAIVVPTEAVHWDGESHVVFVRDKNFLEAKSFKVFHVREVRPGVRSGMNTEIIAGLLPGEVVATKNSAFMRAELLKGTLGEGE